MMPSLILQAGSLILPTLFLLQFCVKEPSCQLKETEEDCKY